MDTRKSREADRGELRWSSERVAQEGSPELKKIIMLITQGHAPGNKKEETKNAKH